MLIFFSLTIQTMHSQCSTLSPTAYWPMDGDTDDASGNNHNAQFTTQTNTAGDETGIIPAGGTTSYSTGVDGIGQAIQFDGSYGVQYSNGSAGQFFNNSFTDMTVAFWFQPQSLPTETDPTKASAYQVLYDEGGANNGITMYIFNNNLYLAVRSVNSSDSSGDSFIVLHETLSLENNSWYHTAITFEKIDNSSSNVTLYLDNEPTQSVVVDFLSNK